MADSFTSRLRLRLQQTGANRNTWGQLLNAAVAQLLEDAVSGAAAITVAATDVTLTSQNGANDQARMAMLILGGAPGATRNIIVPSVTKHYIVINNTGFDQVVKTASVAGVTVPTGARQFIVCDGTTVAAVQASTLGTVANSELLDGLDSTAFAQLALFNVFQKGFAAEFQDLVDGGTVSLDASQGNNFYLAIGGNRTLVISNVHDGQEIELWVEQDGTGGRTLAFPGNVTFETGSSGDLSLAPGSLDRVVMKYNQSLDTYIARSALNASATTINLTATGAYVNLNVWELAGSPAGGTTVNFVLETGARVTSLSPGVPALDFAGFDSGSIVNFVNRGKVMGRGGKGGRGGVTWRLGSADAAFRGEAGGAGGTAVRGPGSGRTFSITNAAGFIWGGGGGGGGGGVSSDDGSNAANGGGGGGGGGAGDFGTGGQLVDIEGTAITAGSPGTNGSYATTTANGTGGVGTETGTAEGGDGAAGGDWGTAGSNGVSPTGQTRDIPGGGGGAAGLAVDQNGGTATFVSGSGSPNTKGAVT